MASEQTNSILLPSLRRELEEVDLRNLMEDMNFRDVDRVDFFEMFPPKSHWRQAVVYFKEKGWPEVARFMQQDSDKYMFYCIGENDFHSPMIINPNPIPNTYQNIHQIAFSMQRHSEYISSALQWIDWLVDENQRNRQCIERLEMRITKLTERSGMMTPPRTVTDFKDIQPPQLVRRTARDYRNVADLEEGEILEESSV